MGNEFILLLLWWRYKLSEYNASEGEHKTPKIDPKTNLAGVLERLNGESTVADVCCKQQISETLYYRWRDEFLEGGSLAGGATKNKELPWLATPFVCLS